MKTALFLLLFCLAGADDIRWDFQQFKRQLEGQYADLASRLSTSETKIAELVAELHKHKADQLQSGLDQFQDSLNLVTKEQDCLRRKLCERDGFTYGAGLCYYISTEKKNWEESRQWCRNRQSDLMVIKEKEKQDLVASFNKRIWLGLSDRLVEGSFQWVDGTPLTTPTYWMPGEPEDSTYPNAEEDCVEYYDGSQADDPNRGWNDAPCSIHIAYWMCERVPC